MGFNNKSMGFKKPNHKNIVTHESRNILTQSVQTELAGNLITLCPVGHYFVFDSRSRKIVFHTFSDSDQVANAALHRYLTAGEGVHYPQHFKGEAHALTTYLQGNNLLSFRNSFSVSESDLYMSSINLDSLESYPEFTDPLLFLDFSKGVVYNGQTELHSTTQIYKAFGGPGFYKSGSHLSNFYLENILPIPKMFDGEAPNFTCYCQKILDKVTDQLSTIKTYQPNTAFSQVSTLQHLNLMKSLYRTLNSSDEHLNKNFIDNCKQLMSLPLDQVSGLPILLHLKFSNDSNELFNSVNIAPLDHVRYMPKTEAQRLQLKDILESWQTSVADFTKEVQACMLHETLIPLLWGTFKFSVVMPLTLALIKEPMLVEHLLDGLKQCCGLELTEAGRIYHSDLARLLANSEKISWADELKSAFQFMKNTKTTVSSYISNNYLNNSAGSSGGGSLLDYVWKHKQAIVETVTGAYLAYHYGADVVSFFSVKVDSSTLNSSTAQSIEFKAQ